LIPVTNGSSISPSFHLFPSHPILVFSSHLPPTERTLMTVTTLTVPDEETPLLGDQRASATVEATEPGSGAATLAGPSNQGSPTPSVKGKAGVNGGSGVVKKTPLPWAQFSIVLFLQLAEPLTSQVIYPVSCSVGFFFSFSFCSRVPMGFHRTLNDTFCSLHRKSVRTASRIC